MFRGACPRLKNSFPYQVKCRRGPGSRYSLPLPAAQYELKHAAPSLSQGKNDLYSQGIPSIGLNMIPWYDRVLMFQGLMNHGNQKNRVLCIH